MLPAHDELKRALSRKQPAADFTARLMDQVRVERPAVRRFPLKRWSIVGAIAASLTVGVYIRQQRRAEPPPPSPEAELAVEQLFESLQVAGWKIHQAREAVFEPQAEESQ